MMELFSFVVLSSYVVAARPRLDPVLAEFNNCSFYYWRMSWRRALRTCEHEDMQLLCYKSKQEVDDIAEDFRLSASANVKADLEIWLSSKTCSESLDMEECLSVYISQSESSSWHFFQEDCHEPLPFVCCVPGRDVKPSSTTTVGAANDTATPTDLSTNSDNTYPTTDGKTVENITSTKFETTDDSETTTKSTTFNFETTTNGIKSSETETESSSTSTVSEDLPATGTTQETRTASEEMPITYTAHETSGTVTVAETTENNPIQFACPSPFGLFPDPTSCVNYYQCSYSTPYLMKCPSDLHFNPSLQVCDWPNKAGCG